MKNAIRRLAAGVLAALCMLPLGGCSALFSDDTEALMRPPRPTGDKAGIHELIEKTAALRALKRPALASYVAVTVRHAAIDLLKRQGREKERIVGLEELSEEAVECPLDEGPILREQVERLQKVWALLDQETRLLLEGKYILDYDNGELGRLLGCRPDSVRMKLTRARRKVLRLMGEEGRLG